MCKLSLTEASNLFMNDLRSSQLYQDSMAQLIAEADARYESDMAQLEELFPDELTVEEVEIELASIDKYRDEVLDIYVDEADWINDNIKMSDILGDKYECRDKENIIDVLSSAFQISPAKTKRLIRTGLGIRKGSEYQRKQKRYVDDLIDSFDNGLYVELSAHLKKAKLYNFYRAILEYTRRRISLTPLSNNEDELSFYVIYDKLRKVCVDFNVICGLSDSQLWEKLIELCNLGLLDNLISDRLDEKQLSKANGIASYVSNKIKQNTGGNVFFNRRNLYVLNELTPNVQQEAIKKIQLEKKCRLRKKQKNATTLAMVHGIEHQQRVMSQAKPNINSTKLRNFINAANILLKNQRYFTEKQLRIQYMKKDHRIKKKDAMLLTAEYLPKVVLDINCIATRVNKDTREKYSIPSRIKSNTVIYILED